MIQPESLQSPPRVELTFEPDEDRTREWLRQVLADARAWALEQRSKEAA